LLSPADVWYDGAKLVCKSASGLPKVTGPGLYGVEDDTLYEATGGEL